jgi:hypothetical protein
MSIRRFAMTSKKKQSKGQEKPSPKEVELQKHLFLKRLANIIIKKQGRKKKKLLDPDSNPDEK